jgi:hypothetical protein
MTTSLSSPTNDAPSAATDPRPILAALVGSAGLVHVAAAAQHTDEPWTLSAVYVLAAAAQLVVAWMLARRRAGTTLLTAAAAGNAVLALLWIVTRTSGVMLGSDAGGAEVGVGDTIATALELAFVALAAALLRSPGLRLGWMDGPVAARLTYAALSAAMLIGALGGHEH